MAHQQIAAACVGSGDVAFRAQAEARGPVLRLSDVADLSGLPAALRVRAANLPLPWRTDERATIAVSTLGSVAQARMPLLACWLRHAGGGTITLVPSVPSKKPASGSADRMVGVKEASSVQPGDILVVSVGIGAVRVERRIEVMQRARAGQRLFVRDGDGRLLSVRYAEARP